MGLERCEGKEIMTELSFLFSFGPITVPVKYLFGLDRECSLRD